ncbi:uncharacterized protein Z520_03560 [Fonsecaea multimorphosa CBS 102226]|uniref:F-box domain-containing protein n=1 Tax=Fonsecaea multimorphosa CBS 102226 TaxID=1442371 RepID=A0A0D2KVY7_9EURO|nr:uncharacterized protein Z520_03560 [Fonsecaea multimorphosa CBS 102226]KIY00894.1 hypothetical protein Z520_03560 [Fonsecaea multimorphosa CBS 102226]OAL27720.1 hypothetical protein AYO22_03386 [Fonsecaea multimorphosa]
MSNETQALSDGSPPLLLDVLSNSIVLDNTLQYLPLSTLFALARTCRSFRDLILHTASVFRYVDLSKCRGAYVSPNLLTRIDSGGHSWRAERMDENLTEDEFYAGPLRGVLAKLAKLKVLQNVHTLVLDDLASVTVDLINDIVTRNEYNVRLLSIRRCLNINQYRLQQLLCHICRPGRPEGTPRLQGIYVFTPPPPRDWSPDDLDFSHAFHYNFDTMGVLEWEPIPLRRQSDKNRGGRLCGTERWYSPSGYCMAEGSTARTNWEETLQKCQGILSFDAVLCTHMHADMAPVLHPASKDYLLKEKPGIRPLATVALGPAGCSGCGREPHGAPVWDESDLREFPLLWPPPHTGKLVDAVRPPLRLAEDGRILPQRLIVSCPWCLANRHCDSCHQWWCADCYNPERANRAANLERFGSAARFTGPSDADLGIDRTTIGASSPDDTPKVSNGLCVENCPKRTMSVWGTRMVGARDGGAGG